MRPRPLDARYAKPHPSRAGRCRTPGRSLPGILMAGASSPVQAQDVQQALSAAQSRWQGAGLSSYRFAYQKHCPCYRDAPAMTIVTVRDGSIASVHYRHPGATEDVIVAADRIEWYWTVSDLFELIASASMSDTTELRAAFDPERGYPTYIYLDYDLATVGDEIELRVAELTATP
jgi:hypothetical protein